MRTFAVALAAGLIATAAGAQTPSQQPGTSETPSSPPWSQAEPAQDMGRGGMQGEMRRGEMGRGEMGRGESGRMGRGEGGRGDYAYGMGHHGHHGMMRQGMQQPSRGAMFRISRGDTRIVVRCDSDEPMRACVEAATTLLDKISPAR